MLITMCCHVVHLDKSTLQIKKNVNKLAFGFPQQKLRDVTDCPKGQPTSEAKYGSMLF